MTNINDDEYLTIVESKNDSRVYINGKNKSMKKYFSKLKSDVYFGKIVNFKKTKDGYFYEKLCDDTLYDDYRVYTDNFDSKFNREIERLYKVANMPKNLKKSYDRENELYTSKKGIFKRNLVKYSGYGETLALQVMGAIALLLVGAVGNLLINSVPMIICDTIILGRIAYILYKTIDSTNKELKNVKSNTKYSTVKEKKETKEVKQEVKKEIKKDVKKTVTPKKNISNKELTLSYLKSEYRKLYLEREKMIKNNCSKEQIKLITDKMNEVGKRAFKIEIGEEVCYDKGVSRKFKK